MKVTTAVACSVYMIAATLSVQALPTGSSLHATSHDLPTPSLPNKTLELGQATSLFRRLPLLSRFRANLAGNKAKRAAKREARPVILNYNKESKISLEDFNEGRFNPTEYYTIQDSIAQAKDGLNKVIDNAYHDAKRKKALELEHGKTYGAHYESLLGHTNRNQEVNEYVNEIGQFKMLD